MNGHFLNLSVPPWTYNCGIVGLLLDVDSSDVLFIFSGRIAR